MKYDISFDTLGAAVMTPLGCRRKRSYIEVADDEVRVRPCANWWSVSWNRTS
jgi:hypothetical protein